MIITSDHVIFYGGESPYSNFYNKAPYVLHGIMFPTVEHGFQWEKAVFFGDATIAKEILLTNDPGEAKYLGKRKLKGFDEDAWSAVSLRLMVQHLTAKFDQNPKLYHELVEHYSSGRRFFEGSKRDALWGTGLWEKDTHDALEAGTGFPGQNLLGVALNTVANKFIATNPWLAKGNTLEQLVLIQSEREKDEEEDYE